jgi:hypothetical protein
MLRRDFLSMLCAGAAVGALPRAAKSSQPDTLDLRVPVRLAVSCISNRMDPSMGYRPWFLVEVKDSKPIRLRHDVWDFGDMSGRFLEGLILARNMFDPTKSMLQDEGRIRGFLSSHLGPDGLVMNPDKHDVDHMFAQGSALYGLVTDFNDGHSVKVKGRIRSLIDGLNERARQEDDYLWFPEVATPIAPCSHMAAYQVLPVVRFYELTSEPSALRYAERLSRWAFYHDPTVTNLGVITKTGWEGHLHAWMDTYSGIIRCARAGRNLDRKEVVTRAHLLFEWVKQNYTTPYGWVADSVGSETCETCTISSAIRLALELIKEGYTDYWDDVERFVRNQVIQNQFRDVNRLGIEDEATVRGLTGSFESYAAPNTLIASRDAGIEGCCINGGIRALFLAYANAIQESDESIQINLLVSNATPGVRVVSYLPFEGRLDLFPRSGRALKVRLPKWLRAEDVTANGPSGLQQAVDKDGHFMRLSGATPGTRITLTFKPRDEDVTSDVARHHYDLTWRADTVMKLGPAGKPYPIYRSDSLPDRQVSPELETALYRQPKVRW